MEYSTHYGFRLPQPHDPVLVDDLNQNFRSLDDIIRKESGTVSTADSQQVFYGVFNPKDNYEVIAETGSSPAAAQAINPDRSRYFTLTNQANPKVNLFRASDQKKLTSFTFSNLSAGSPFAFLGVDDTHVAIQHNKTVFVVKYTGDSLVQETTHTLPDKSDRPYDKMANYITSPSYLVCYNPESTWCFFFNKSSKLAGDLYFAGKIMQVEDNLLYLAGRPYSQPSNQYGIYTIDMDSGQLSQKFQLHNNEHCQIYGAGMDDAHYYVNMYYSVKDSNLASDYTLELRKISRSDFSTVATTTGVSSGIIGRVEKDYFYIGTQVRSVHTLAKVIDLTVTQHEDVITPKRISDYNGEYFNISTVLNDYTCAKTYTAIFIKKGE
jgi:hypothetical protein